MKRLLVVVFALSLVLAVSGSTFAAIHHEDYDSVFFSLNSPPITDTWYTVLFYPSHLTVSYFNIDDLDWTTLGLDFYVNSQMFAGYRSWDVAGDTTSVLSGSYLFDFGLFIGYESISTDSTDSSVLSPGYRYSFGRFNYVAASLNYNTDTEKIEAYDFDAFYVTNQIKLKGEVLLKEGEDALISLSGAYKISAPLCVGAIITTGGGEEDTFIVGGTYTGINKLILDGQIGTLSGKSGYAVSGMYKITDQLLVGAQNVKAEILGPDPYSYLKVKYHINKEQKVVFQYKIDDPTEIILCYEQLFLQ